MYILGLNIGHNATACLLKDGEIIGCISEERFSRIKNYSGIPFKSIDWLLKSKEINIKDIDLIVLDNHYPILKEHYFVRSFLKNYTEKNFLKRVISTIGYEFPKTFFRYLHFKERFGKKNNEESIKHDLSKDLDFPVENIKLIDHHLAHALSPCFNLLNKKTLIFTLDGEGSGLCATVNIFDGKNIKKISQSDKTSSIGYLYAITTIFLGMKPLEHEFKVMGLAPYAKKEGVKKVYNKLKDLIEIDDNLEFKSKFNMYFFDKFLEKNMKFERFDNLAGGVQKLSEELICEWIEKTIKKTKIHKIAVSGGVFMNVKVNQKISELPEVKEMFIMPSCGDESNAIGSCFYGYKKYCEKYKIKFNPKPIESLYLGPEYNEEYIQNIIEKLKLRERYDIKKIKNIEKEIAKLLSKGEIVARCSGKSEWGARALGNRSILANPNNSDTIRILNETIKDRDFWMPFTPSILKEDEANYVFNPKNINSPHMTITFNSTETAKKNIPAAMHPYDFTVRPQIVSKEGNKEYYEIIKEFKKITGAGGILNTSFNLHGEPNVLTPEDALHTVEKSDLKYLALGEYLFKKI